MRPALADNLISQASERCCQLSLIRCSFVPDGATSPPQAPSERYHNPGPWGSTSRFHRPSPWPLMGVASCPGRPAIKMGGLGTRNIPAELGGFASSVDAWDRRTKSGQASGGISCSRVTARRGPAAWSALALARRGAETVPSARAASSLRSTLVCLPERRRSGGRKKCEQQGRYPTRRCQAPRPSSLTVTPNLPL